MVSEVVKTLAYSDAESRLSLAKPKALEAGAGPFHSWILARQQAAQVPFRGEGDYGALPIPEGSNGETAAKPSQGIDARRRTESAFTQTVNGFSTAWTRVRGWGYCMEAQTCAHRMLRNGSLDASSLGAGKTLVAVSCLAIGSG